MAKGGAPPTEIEPRVHIIGGTKRSDIADGFHRVSLVYRIDPFAEIPLKLA